MDVDGNSHRSQLPQPTKLIAPIACLSDVTDSQSNIRYKHSSTPSTASLKHKITLSCSEPEPKRKTLVERAGEPKSNRAPKMNGTHLNLAGSSLIRSVRFPYHSFIRQSENTFHTRTVISELIIFTQRSGHGRENMFSNSPHAKLELTRKISIGNFSNSVGPGSRPAIYLTRSQLGFSQSTSTRPTSMISKTRQPVMPGNRDDRIIDVSKEYKREGWDVEGRLKNMEVQYLEMQETIKDASMDKKSLEESLVILKSRNSELETHQCQLSLSNKTLQSEVDTMRMKIEMSQQSLLDMTKSLNDSIRSHQVEVEEIQRQNRIEVERIRRDNVAEIDRLSRLSRDHLREAERQIVSENDAKLRELERQNAAILENEKKSKSQEIRDLEMKFSSESASFISKIQEKDCEILSLRNELSKIQNELDRELDSKNHALKELTSIREASNEISNQNHLTIKNLEHSLSSLRARIQFLESGSKAQSDSFAEMEARLEEAQNLERISREKLVKEESLRRSLFNQVQELKGNIRVMCRIRPTLGSSEGNSVQLKIPDKERESKELELLGKEEKSSLGNITRKTHSFSFDRVFGPDSNNQEVFEEISQLVQSALDGYNVCIFCYGQTGSGKTHTMSSPDGMIPRATQQIYDTATNLKDKGWNYSMEGKFVEVYNEEIHDLLCNSKESEKKKHEIRHDDQKKQTIVTGVNSVILDSPSAVEVILNQAAANRSVAATKSNERSSRSHSVFMLKLVGHNTITNERCEGTLNLVDLAGSERLKSSGAEGERMKETQNINKSLSCLGDVIGALGQGKGSTHIPYRNSKLTYLLQYSLGGNSKSLMFVMASPLEAHLSETLTSLKFATKVHNTHIGIAKKTRKFSNDP